MARRLDDPDAYVVTFLCDTGERYLSKVFNDEWMRENQMLDAAPTTHRSRAGAQGRQRAGDRERGAGSDGAPGHSPDGAAQCVAGAGDGWHGVHWQRGGIATHIASHWPIRRCWIMTVSDVMDQPFPTVDSDQPVESVAKLLSKCNRAVLMKKDGVVQGIVTRFDVLEYLMHR